MNIDVNGLSCGYGKKSIVSDISFKLFGGEILCILGPNGVGKTTLFKTILGFLPRLNGSVHIEGEEISNLTREEMAKKVAYVPQAHIPPFPFTVDDVILMGRFSRFEGRRTPNKKDYEKVKEVMELLHIEKLSGRIYTKISGGERQMVLIARALAQEPKYLVMDEPTSNLDFGNQMRVLEQIVRLKESGIGIVMTSHYPDHAFLCNAKVLLMKQDNKFHIGHIDEVLTEENLSEAYGILVKIIHSKDTQGDLLKSCAVKFNKGEKNDLHIG